MELSNKLGVTSKCLNLIWLVKLVVDKFNLPIALLTLWTCRQNKMIKIENKAIFPTIQSVQIVT